MIIDIHNHPDWHGHDLKKFLENMEKYHIDKTWLLSWESPRHEYDSASDRLIPETGQNGPIPFSRCISYAERAPGKFILGYGPDPRKPEGIDKLRAAVEIYGAKICGEIKLRMMYDNPDALDMFRYCGEKGLPVLLHIDYDVVESGSNRRSYWYGGGINVLERVLEACPETNFIGHAPGFWAHISADDQFRTSNYPMGKIMQEGRLIDLLQRFPNLYCDISAGSGHNALKRDPEFTVKFLTDFQDRILYGRDYFDNVHQEFLNGLGLKNEVLEKIYSGNAMRLIPVE